MIMIVVLFCLYLTAPPLCVCVFVPGTAPESTGQSATVEETSSLIRPLREIICPTKSQTVDRGGRRRVDTYFHVFLQKL